MKELQILKSDNEILLYLAVTLCFLAPAFYNGFPLVYSDTGTYLISGMEFTMPQDRPIFYGLWMYLTSFGWSLWGVIFFQSLVLAIVVVNVCRGVFSLEGWPWILSVALISSAFTGVGWYSSQLMPDIWLAITALSILHLLFSDQKQWLFFSFATLGLLFHNSHLPIIIVALAVIAMVGWFEKNKFSQRWLWPGLAVLTAILILLFTNGLSRGHWSPFRGGQVFLMGRMIDTGLAERYLDNRCGLRTYRLCEYLDELPTDSRTFIWDAESPMQKEGGWEQVVDEYASINRGILGSPKLLISFIGQSITGTIGQLLQNGIGSGLKSDWYASPQSPPYVAIERHFNHQLNAYLQSRQNINLWQQGLDFRFINILFPLLLLSCLMLLVVPGMLTKEERFHSFLIIKIILANAFIVATFANVYDRLQGRVSWLLVFFILVILSQKLSGHLRDSQVST